MYINLYALRFKDVCWTMNMRMDVSWRVVEVDVANNAQGETKASESVHSDFIPDPDRQRFVNLSLNSAWERQRFDFRPKSSWLEILWRRSLWIRFLFYTSDTCACI